MSEVSSSEEKPHQDLFVPVKLFKCSLCPFYANYDRYDKQYNVPSPPPTTDEKFRKKKTVPGCSILLLESVYLLNDPFIQKRRIGGISSTTNQSQSTSHSSVIIGSKCFLCQRDVCVSSDCSTFYTKRFCLECIANNQEEFPKELLQELKIKLEKFEQISS
ncbi:unnamed protein product [Didymodactylos carnosus]|uniref:Cysteine-rich DPF motif domain-containing protein 1 n=1 Tax=Didymodactylos carnosus TaxID=1234261 RepID=A0A8S2G6I2_9BILA|nr:unnamed protein product [Didymodactylos carnosus]CAF4466751.1 unnamed protein product [Didymodactylos carnosus]